MNYKDLLKKYWFVVLIGVAMIAFLIGYGVNAYKNRDIKVDPLSKDGSDVVITIGDDVYYTADELFNDMYEQLGPQQAFVSYYKAVIDQAVESSSELTTYAANWASYLLQTEDESELLESLQGAGYSSLDDLADYCLSSLKYSTFMDNHYQDNYDTLIQPLIDEQKPRQVSHILVTVADIESVTNEDGTTSYVLHPTDEETAKLNEVVEALKTRDFADVAAEYGEDGTASSGGVLGITFENNPQSFVAEFHNATQALALNTVSDPVETSFGYHIIKVDEVSFEDLMSDSNFYSLITSTYVNEDVKAIVAKGTELGYEIKSEDLLNYIDSMIGEAE